MGFEKLRFRTTPPPSTIGPEELSAEKRHLVTQRVRLLFGSYRQGEAADGEVYTVAIASVLMCYRDDVIITVTDPVYGLPGKSKWLPTVAEVKEECERVWNLRKPIVPRLRALPEPEIPEDERERVGRRFRELADELGPEPKRPEHEKKLAEARLEIAQAEGWGDIKLSPEALAKLSPDMNAEGRG